MRGNESSRLVVLSLGLALAVGFGAPSQPARADGIPPVTLQVKEQEAGRFLVEWKVPRQVGPRGIPSPVLPESCRAVGERGLSERSGAWFLRQVYLCDDGLAGQPIGIDFPILNATISTILRVELLSGDRYAHSFAPVEGSWTVPDAAAGGARALYRAGQRSVLAGIEHFVGHGAHWALVLAFLLLGSFFSAGRLAAAFAAGQAGGMVLSQAVGVELEPRLAEVGVAAAVAVLAGQALLPAERRKHVAMVAGGAGLVHGLGLTGLVASGGAQEASGLAAGLISFGLLILGMDAALLVGAAIGSGLRRLAPEAPRPRLARVAAYVAAIAAIALVLGTPAVEVASASEAGAGMRLPDLPIPEGATGTPTSRRVAAPFPDAPLQSFVAIAAFEVRHEVLVRVRDMAPDLGLDPVDQIPVDAQNELKQDLQDLVTERTRLTIDGRDLDRLEVRVDFLTLEQNGALPRLAPVAESADEAWVGVTSTYLTEKTPASVSLTWNGFNEGDVVPATVTDPESSRSVELTAGQASLEWSNELAEDPTPVVEAVTVEPALLWLPLLSLAVVGLATGVGVRVRRVGRRSVLGPIARLALAAAVLLAPVGAVAVPSPLGVDPTPDPDDARRILARLLPNVYRALEYPTESASYDRLATSVTGNTLADVYLQNRQAVRLEERGGARARVEAVEVLDVSSVAPGDAAGFIADAVWTVGGTVTHFGHRHFRQNRYDARVAVVPEDGIWKILTLEVLNEQRLR